METRGRAFYNFLKMNWEEDPSLSIESWQVEEYRSLPLDVLFERLENLGTHLDEERFKAEGEQYSSPEEMIENLWAKEDLERFDEGYLLLFELWRRLLPERQSLSIFCDQLDVLIDLYDREELANEELLHEALADLERILDEHVDQGAEPHQIFTEVSQYCAHDLESFIYDFASDEIDHNHPLHASELIDGFSSYIERKKWFEFLQLRLLASTDPEEAQVMISNLLDDEPDFELLLEIARFLVNRGNIVDFLQTIKQAKESIQTEQDFQELLAISCEFYRLLDREEETEKICEILKERQGNSLDQTLDEADPLLEEYFRLIEDFDRSKA